MYRIPNQALLLALCTLSVSFSDSEALLRFTDSLVVHWAFLFDAKACPHPQTALFTWTSVLHRGHTFLRRKLNSIAFAINRAKYQTLHSRKNPATVPTPESAPRVPARRLCTRMRIDMRVHVRQNGRPNVPYGKQITL